jgi:glycosyltransferase involved in cell wall biosynthesis
MKPHCISIIVATYNAENTLQATLDSIRTQKTSEVELIVIDGLSTDKTLSIIDNNKDIVDVFVSEPDSGIYDAWNKGVALCSGEWIAFVGADDVYTPSGLLCYLNKIKLVSESCEYISSRVRYKPLRGHARNVGAKWSWPAFQRTMTVAHGGSLHRKSLYSRLGIYDKSYRICGDYEFLLRARGELQVEFIDEVTLEMSGGGVSNTNLNLVYLEASRAKYESGGRSKVICEAERHLSGFKSFLRKYILDFIY